MIIYRQPPFPLQAVYEGLEPLTEYGVNIFSTYSVIRYADVLTTDENGTLTIEFNRVDPNESDAWDFTRYDEEYSIEISPFIIGGELIPVIIDDLDIVRPYVNPLIGPTPEIIEQQKYEERLARIIIGAYTDGFAFYRDVFEIVGTGADFLPLPARINRIDRVTENNLEIFNRATGVPPQNQFFGTNFVSTYDRTAITAAVAGEYQYRTSRPVNVPLAYSDSFALYDDNNDSPPASAYAYNNAAIFPRDYYYTVEGEFGWPVIPTDIQDATRLLMNDIRTNALAYTNKYISQYDTDQFTIKHDPAFLQGTGNRVVDQILSKYTYPVYKFGVL